MDRIVKKSILRKEPFLFMECQNPKIVVSRKEGSNFQFQEVYLYIGPFPQKFTYTLGGEKKPLDKGMYILPLPLKIGETEKGYPQLKFENFGMMNATAIGPVRGIASAFDLIPDMEISEVEEKTETPSF